MIGPGRDDTRGRRPLVVRALSVGLLGLAWASCGAGPAEPSAETARPNILWTAGGRPNVHSGVELLALNVVVTDRENHFIEGLGLGNCRVYEDGVRQELTFFSGDPTALDLVILLDVSSSMGNKMGFVRRAATDFVDVLRPIDRGAVLTFNQGLTVPQTLTDDRAAIKAAILGTRPPRGDGAVHDTLRDPARADSRRRTGHRGAATRDRRPVGRLRHGERRRLRRRAEPRTSRRRGYLHDHPAARRAIDRWTRGQGGVCNRQGRVRDEDARAGHRRARLLRPTGCSYDAIAADLSSQYALGYASSNLSGSGAFRRVTVQVLGRPGVRSRTRPGYYASREPIHVARLERSARDEGPHLRLGRVHLAWPGLAPFLAPGQGATECAGPK